MKTLQNIVHAFFTVVRFCFSSQSIKAINVRYNYGAPDARQNKGIRHRAPRCGIRC